MATTPPGSDALRTGFIEGDGPLYPQVRTEIRPRPERSFEGRIYAVANSSDSVEACARVGGRMIMFAEAHWERRLPGIEHYNLMGTQPCEAVSATCSPASNGVSP